MMVDTSAIRGEKPPGNRYVVKALAGLAVAFRGA